MDPDNNTTSHIFSTFFYQKLLDLHNDDASLANQYNYDAVRRWGCRAPSRDIFQLQQLLIPINIGVSHWICMEIDFPKHNIRLLDSMLETTAYDQDRDIVGAHILHYLQDEHQARHGRDLPL